MRQKIINQIQKAPNKPGVYIFYQKKTPLYVGKASNLKNRLQSYLKANDLKTQWLHQEATNLKYKTLRSEIEALLVESQLIKSLKPRYNILFRDDKSYFYVAFTKEKFPKIFVTHKAPLFKKNLPPLELIGPFTEGTSLRQTLRLFRQIFPYCTCLKSHSRPCLNAQINNCLGFCCQKTSSPSQEEIKKYQKNIQAIKKILLGQFKKLPSYPFNSQQLKMINHILAHHQFLEIKKTSPEINSPYLKRVECYDISHLAGKETVGVMTVFIDGQPVVREWRKFKIKTAPPSHDPQAMAEVIERRLRHPEWPYPHLIILDGGAAQLSAVQKIISQSKISNSQPIKVIAFAKPKAQVYGWLSNKKPTPLTQIPLPLQNLIKKAIYHTHRWALKYHRQVRNKLFLQEVV